jgi:hypothetical protein
MISLDPSAVPPPHRKLEVEEDEGLFCDENRCLGGYEEIVIHGGRKMDDVAPCWQKNHLKNPPCQKNHFKNRQGVNRTVSIVRRCLIPGFVVKG